eukprot:jgi/Undpi1/6096/HiC_scaffold_20.g08581.m1
MATALVGSPTGESRAEQERQFSRHEDGLQREVEPPEAPQATKEMCAYCFDVIVAHFNSVDSPPPSFITSYICGMFVTWDKHEEGLESLRGCVGTLSPMAISSLKDYTFSSALNDTRFFPIQPSELSSLDVSVSLLVKFEQARHWEDWEVGVHGIVIKFTDDRGSGFSATFLPEVAAEQGWTKKVTLTRLVRKAGYKRSVDSGFLAGVQVTRYQSSKCKLPYKEYLEMRRQV